MSNVTRAALLRELRLAASPRQAKIARWFFKTGKGEYGAGDRFTGIRVPVVRKLAKQYRELALVDAVRLLASTIHEHRMVALYIMIQQFDRGDRAIQTKIYRLYVKHRRQINNWDLVDTTAPNIVGTFLLNRPRTELYRLARSKMLWDRRIAILATYTYIRQGDFTDTLKIATLLVRDSHDLMHKAVGWMLREVGNRDQAAEEQFLKKYYRSMPRTMLRYAIEKFPERIRKRYLAGTI
ncbi:MAG: DNA alkylation repair protein [Candidatus Kerfeldbacteria bacterium]|nr:DNA alkylation repair protein [Candidatus Kerfeldbacteria bacterium]